MKKTVLTYGLISGAIGIVFMFFTFFVVADHGTKGLIVGYTGIVLSSLLIFFGVRSYRENVGDGRISFGRAFGVGILIAFISATCYVAAWELVYFKLSPGVADKMIFGEVTRLKDTGAAQDQIDAATLQAESFKQMYDNPLINVAFTYIEPFPVGLVVTLISAAILRRKP